MCKITFLCVINIILSHLLVQAQVDTLTLHDMIIQDKEYFKAYKEIYAGQNFLVTPGGEATFECGGTVTLEPCFSIQEQGKFMVIGNSELTSTSLIYRMPDQHVLHQNYPNPFNSCTTINYELQKPGRVVMALYNTRGQHVRTLVDAYQNGGHHSVEWDARDEHGITVSSGVYLYKLHIFRGTDKVLQINRKMIVLK